MAYLSTKQAAEAWGISTRRVALLASQGRLKGAVNVGNTWLIPDDTAKPADMRTCAAKKPVEEKKHNRFPYLLWSVRSKDQVNSFSAHEKTLYRACLLFENGNYSDSYSLAASLLSSDDINMRLGALYLQSFNSLYQQDYDSVDVYSVLFNTEYQNIREPDISLRCLMDSFNAEMGRMSDCLIHADSYDCKSFETDMYPYLTAIKLCAKLSRFSSVNSASEVPDLTVYEMVCQMSESAGYCYAAMYMHIILSMIFGILGTKDEEYYHLRHAIEICAEHNFYSTFSCCSSPNADVLESLLPEFPREVGEHIRKGINTYILSQTEYAYHLSWQHKKNILTDDERLLISCCLHNYSISSMADKFGLSRSGINRRLACLYDKLGVSTRKELKKYYNDSMYEWGK